MVAPDLKVFPEDFDEDISDIGASDEQDDKKLVTTDEDDRDGDVGSKSPDNRKPSKPYQGSDAGYYYELNQCKWWKRETQDMREQDQRGMQKYKAFERKKVEDVRHVRLSQEQKRCETALSS